MLSPNSLWSGVFAQDKEMNEAHGIARMTNTKRFSSGLLTWILFLFVAVFLSFAQLRNIMMVFGQRFADSINATQGIIDGLPHWRMFQSRVLGPFFIRGLELLTGLQFDKAYLCAIFIFLLIFYLVLLNVAKDIWKSTVAAIATATAAYALNSILMQGQWLYPWDYIDLTIYVLVTWIVLTSRPLWLVAVVLIVEAFNREAGLVICAWLAFDAVVKFSFGPRKLPRIRIEISWKQLFVALGIALFTLTIIESLRNTLMIREIGPEIFLHKKKSDSFLHILLTENLKMFLFHRAEKLKMLTIVFDLLILSIPIFTVRGLFSKDGKVARLSLLYLILWSATMVFPFIYETRVWLFVVPYLALVFPKNLSVREKTRDD